jgi:hypothetical protein
MCVDRANATDNRRPPTVRYDPHRQASRSSHAIPAADRAAASSSGNAATTRTSTPTRQPSQTDNRGGT